MRTMYRGLCPNCELEIEPTDRLTYDEYIHDYIHEDCQVDELEFGEEW